MGSYVFLPIYVPILRLEIESALDIKNKACNYAGLIETTGRFKA